MIREMFLKMEVRKNSLAGLWSFVCENRTTFIKLSVFALVCVFFHFFLVPLASGFFEVFFVFCFDDADVLRIFSKSLAWCVLAAGALSGMRNWEL